MYQQEAVRKACLRDGKSQRAVSRELGMARNTVSKLLKETEPPRYHLTKAKARPILDEYIAIMNAWIEADESAPRKQRHTAKRIYDRLVAEYGFPGCERTVRKYVAQAREKVQESFLPLVFQPGEMAQVDWIEKVTVLLAGKACKVDIFGLVLNHSGAFYFEAFDGMKQEAFFEGHAHAFAFLGGVPRTLTYDNLKTAVTKVLRGKSRLENERFVAFRSAYLFDSQFCNPRKGNEKGRIENMVKFAERNLLTPVPQVESLGELNALLRQRCLDYLTHTQARQTQRVGDRLQAEKEQLLPLPSHPPECCRILPVKASKFALIQFETNRYSVPSAYAYQDLWLKAFVDRVEITNQEAVIATHPHMKGRFQESIQPEHYGKVLERKPGAARHLRGGNASFLPRTETLQEASILPKLLIEEPNLLKYRQLSRRHDHEPTPSAVTGNLSQETEIAQYAQSLS
jgi:transposase